jgi:hypothetical protein
MRVLGVDGSPSTVRVGDAGGRALAAPTAVA